LIAITLTSTLAQKVKLNGADVRTDSGTLHLVAVIIAGDVPLQ